MCVCMYVGCYVCVLYVHAYMWMLMSANGHRGQRRISGVLFCHRLPCFLESGFLVEFEVGLMVKQAPEILLSLSLTALKLQAHA